MPFQFRLETVLSVRRNLEEEVQNKLSHEIFVLDNHKSFLAQLIENRAELANTFDVKKKTNISAGQFSFYVEALHTYDGQIEFQRNAIKAQEKIVEDVRVELADKVKDRRIVERMKEKDYIAYQKDTARKEQNEHDELAVLRFGHGENF